MREKVLAVHYLLVVIGLTMLFSCGKQPQDEFYIYELADCSLSNANNSGEAPSPDSDTIPSEAYAIKLNLSFEAKDGYYNSVPVNEDMVNVFFVTSDDTINGIPPNHSLNELFYFSTGSGVGIPIEASAQFYTDMFSSTMPTHHDTNWSESVYLLMMDPPDVPGLYNFYVFVSLSDGRTMYPMVTATLY